MIGVKQLIKKIMSIMNAYGEIGAIYITANNINPATIFGGKWTKLEGRFLLGSSSSYAVNSTGGAATATISLPNHYHQVRASGDAGSNVSGSTHYFVWLNNSGGSRLAMTSVGGGGAHNNIPAYKAVNIWRRTG